MKNRILQVFSFVLIAALFVQCEKGDTDIVSIELGIDTKTNLDALQKALQLRGNFYDSLPLPSSTVSPPPPRISLGQEQIDLRSNSEIYIPFTISNLNPLVKACAFNLTVMGASGFWKTPVYYDTSTNTFAISFVVPKLIKLGEFSLIFNADICYQNKVYVTTTDTVGVIVIPTIPCSDSIRGLTGLTMRKINLGDQKGKVKVRYCTNVEPDRIDLRYGNDFIFSTGKKLQPGRYPTCDSDGFISTGRNVFQDFTFDYDPKVSKEFVVYGFGSCEYIQTDWKVVVECPK